MPLPLGPTPVAIACNIIDLIYKVVERIMLMRDNAVESRMLHSRLTSIDNILRTMDGTPLNGFTMYALEKIQDKIEEIVKFMMGLQDTSIAEKLYKASSWRREFSAFERDLCQLCNELVIYQSLGIKMDTTNADSKLDEIIHIVKKNECENIYDNAEIQHLLTEMNLQIREIKEMKVSMSNLIQSSSTLVQIDDLAITKQSIIEKSRPFEISFIPVDEVETKNECGKGSFGTVYESKWKGIKIAIKKLFDVEFKDPLSTKISSETLNVDKVVYSEIKAYQSLYSCPYIARFYGITCMDNCLGIVTEFVNNKSLSYWIYEQPSELNEALVNGIIFGVAQGIGFLHQHKIAHNDIKSNNIMLDLFFIPKLIDLGMVKYHNASTKSSSTGIKRSVGTPQWKAPEYWIASLENIRLAKQFPFAGDVYSFAVVIGELLSKEGPWGDCGRDAIRDGVLEGNRPYDLEMIHDESMFALMQKCWAQDPKDRWNMEQVLEYLELSEIAPAATMNRQSNRSDSAVKLTRSHSDTQPPMKQVIRSPSLIENKSDSSAQSLFLKGLYLYNKKCFKEALVEFVKASQMDHSDSMYSIGLIYLHGLVGHKNVDTAIYWFKKAAVLNNNKSILQLGHLYMKCKEYDNALHWFLKASELNNPSAMNNLGYLYHKGFGVEANVNESIKWYEKSAGLGNHHAMYNLYLLHKDSSIKDAKYWLELSAKHGNSDAMTDLNTMLSGNSPVLLKSSSTLSNPLELAFSQLNKENYQEAFNLFLQCSDECEAMNALGSMYLNGLGVQKNYQKAFEWFKKSSVLFNIEAMCYIGYLYEKGYGVYQSKQKAMQYYQQGSDMGHAECQYNLACLYKNNNDLHTALQWYEKSALLKNSQAMYKAGEMYLFGIGTTKDYKKSFQYFKESADLNNSSAMCSIGYMFDKGLGVEKDSKIAFSWYLKAAEEGNTDAMNNCGFAYKMGLGVSLNYTKSFELYLKAAEMGNENAMHNLACAYRNGQGTNKDMDMAIKWYKQSALLGCLVAQEALNSINSIISFDQN